jgi:hypothetical protein
LGTGGVEEGSSLSAELDGGKLVLSTLALTSLGATDHDVWGDLLVFAAVRLRVQATCNA